MKPMIVLKRLYVSEGGNKVVAAKRGDTVSYREGRCARAVTGKQHPHPDCEEHFYVLATADLRPSYDFIMIEKFAGAVTPPLLEQEFKMAWIALDPDDHRKEVTMIRPATCEQVTAKFCDLFVGGEDRSSIVLADRLFWRENSERWKPMTIEQRS